MARQFFCIDTDHSKIQIGSILFFNSTIAEKQAPVMLLVKVMATHNKSKGRIEVMPLAADNSCVWVDTEDLYFTY